MGQYLVFIKVTHSTISSSVRVQLGLKPGNKDPAENAPALRTSETMLPL
jgi:hypothetical protein